MAYSNRLMNKQDHFEKWLSLQQFSKHAKVTLSNSRGRGHSLSFQLLNYANAAKGLIFIMTGAAPP